MDRDHIVKEKKNEKKYVVPEFLGFQPEFFRETSLRI